MHLIKESQTFFVPLNEYKLSLLDFCNLLWIAYNLVFKFQNITRGFECSGLLKLNPAKLLSTPRPRTNENTSELIDPGGLVALLEYKCLKARYAFLAGNIQVGQCGHVDARCGAVLTGADAMRAARQHASDKIMKKGAYELTEKRRKLKTIQRMTERHGMIVQFNNERNKRRATLACLSAQNYIAQYRSLETRQAEAKTRTLLKLGVLGKRSKNKHHVGVGSVPSINKHHAERALMENVGKGTSVLCAFRSGTQVALRLVLGGGDAGGRTR